MPVCNPTAFPTVAAGDITVGGQTVKEGQTYWPVVPPLDPSGGSGTGITSLAVCKIASFRTASQVMRCYLVTSDTIVVGGSDLVTTVDSPIVTSASSNFLASGITPEHDLAILDNTHNDFGVHRIAAVAPAGDATALQLVTPMTQTASSVSWEIVPAQIWKVDYSSIFFANIMPGSNIKRYFPFMGPGDHKGTNAQVETGSNGLIIVNDGNLTDPQNPVLVGEYIQIKNGPDAGFYEIVAVFQNLLAVVNPGSWSADQQNLGWHIGKTSPHANVCLLYQNDGVNIVMPKQDTIEVKIRSAIRNLADAQALDAARSEGPGAGGGVNAVGLFDDFGAFLACYRLQAVADESGNPLDDRVIIHAKPWRGHGVGGVLFFAANGSQKYDLSDPNEPVLPIRWLRDDYRLEMSIGREAVQEPTLQQLCIVN